ncbi:hypothetical protein HanHA300_Chr16g0627651 [Helianthus annuus]|nr:hypothetical protein HanHA300_Chr16g0627651 [Helianthus annuus]KAJ0462040.1 hypothetical protein HanHA89_Chr16g0678991 [Helianthus annuus]KAJ0642434.1 hypothetical protein HanLR1_Chr16g0638201 [Helianthus annuus]
MGGRRRRASGRRRRPPILSRRLIRLLTGSVADATLQGPSPTGSLGVADGLCKGNLLKNFVFHI